MPVDPIETEGVLADIPTDRLMTRDEYARRMKIDTSNPNQIMFRSDIDALKQGYTEIAREQIRGMMNLTAQEKKFANDVKLKLIGMANSNDYDLSDLFDLDKKIYDFVHREDLKDDERSVLPDVASDQNDVEENARLKRELQVGDYMTRSKFIEKAPEFAELHIAKAALAGKKIAEKGGRSTAEITKEQLGVEPQGPGIMRSINSGVANAYTRIVGGPEPAHGSTTPLPGRNGSAPPGAPPVAAGPVPGVAPQGPPPMAAPAPQAPGIPPGVEQFEDPNTGEIAYVDPRTGKLVVVPRR